jgi:hypothetical protein
MQSVHIATKVVTSNATFNNISVILWRSDLTKEETGVTKKKTLLQLNENFIT